MVPSTSRDTERPLRPSCVYSMAQTYATMGVMPDDEQDWLPLDANPHADDKRDILDPAGEDLKFRRLIWIGLGIGVLVVALVLWVAL